MARPDRQIEPGSLQHIIVRGVERRSIFLDEFDRKRFVERAAEILEDENTLSIVFAVLRNHFHLIVRAGENVSRAMQRLLGGHTLVFNKRHRRIGPLYSDRFFNKPIVSNMQLRIAVLYVALNPLRARAVKSIREAIADPNSGLAGMLGRREDPLVSPIAMRLFGDSMETARAEIFRRIEWALKNPGELDEYELYLQSGNSDASLDDAAEVLEVDSSYVADSTLEQEERSSAYVEAGWTPDLTLSWVAAEFETTADDMRERTRSTSEARAAFVFLARTSLRATNGVLADVLKVTSGRVTQLYEAGRVIVSERELELPATPPP